LDDREEYGMIVIVPESSLRSDRGLRIGEVVAVGPGDKLLKLKCGACGQWRVFIPGVRWAESHDGERPVSKAPLPCRCGSSKIGSTWVHGRADMHLQVGDKIVYSRAPANNVMIEGQEYVFLHEAQHIEGVLEN
jgi:co-chaperonin GroES (HSP10)